LEVFGDRYYVEEYPRVASAFENYVNLSESQCINTLAYEYSFVKRTYLQNLSLKLNQNMVLILTTALFYIEQSHNFYRPMFYF